MQFTIAIILHTFLIAGSLSDTLLTEANEDSNYIRVMRPFSYVAAIKFKDPNHICAGAVVSERKILAAAHCFDSNKESYDGVQVIVGTDQLDGGNSTEVILPIKSVTIHKNYLSKVADDMKKQKDYRNDIAIIEVNETINFTLTNIEPILIARQSAEVNEECTALAWGVTDKKRNTNSNEDISNLNTQIELLSFTISIADQNICSKVNKDNKVLYDEEIMFCAGRLKSYKQIPICYNKTGSLLICDSQLHGIAFHDSDHDCTNIINAPASFTKVYAYTEWLNENGVNQSENLLIYLILHVIIPFLKYLATHILNRRSV